MKNKTCPYTNLICNTIGCSENICSIQEVMKHSDGQPISTTRKSMKTGIDLIKQERYEQIYKHGFSLERDAEYYKNKELVQAAAYCLMLAGFIKKNVFWPEGWDMSYEHKILAKDAIGQMVVAGALYMAENERRNDTMWDDYIMKIADKIDILQNPSLRRIRLDLSTPAELAIRNAVAEVEKAGGDVRLTNAINLLHQARELVADYVDNTPK